MYGIGVTGDNRNITGLLSDHNILICDKPKSISIYWHANTRNGSARFCGIDKAYLPGHDYLATDLKNIYTNICQRCDSDTTPNFSAAWLKLGCWYERQMIKKWAGYRYCSRPIYFPGRLLTGTYNQPPIGQLLARYDLLIIQEWFNCLLPRPARYGLPSCALFSNLHPR